MMVAVASVAFAQSAVAEFGDWTVFETEETLLDSAMKVAYLRSVNDTGLLLRSDPTVRFAVVFDDFLSTEGKDHDQPVIFVTDTRDAEVLDDQGYLSGSSTVMWEGAEAIRLILAIMDAQKVMFRTYDYRLNTVDAVFLINPEDVVSAWKAVQSEDK
jgi:hypothetical protein